MPWWMGCPKDVQSFAMQTEDERDWRRADMALEANDICVSRTGHYETMYAVRYRKPGESERWEWLTREAYCLRALQLLCVTLCRPLQCDFRGVAWRVIIHPQMGEAAVVKRGGTLEEASTDALAEFDPLWRRSGSPIHRKTITHHERNR